MSLAVPPRRPREKLETEIVHEIMLAVNATGFARVWRNNTGRLPDANGRTVTYGLAKGSADLIGSVTVRVWQPLHSGKSVDFARFLALEVKRPGKLPTEDQDRWLRIVYEMGGVAAVVTSAVEALAVITEAQTWLR